MKKIWCISSVLVIALCVFPVWGDAESVLVKFGTVLDAAHPSSQALNYFRQAMVAAYDKNVNIRIFPDSQLGAAREILEGVQFGSIEIGLFSADILAPLSPLLAAVSMPYIFRDDGHRFRVLDGPVGRQLLDSLERSNVIGLGFFDSGAKSLLTTQKHIAAPEDLRDLRIGRFSLCSEDDCQNLAWRVTAEAFTAMGAALEPLSQTEFDESRQAGELDGWEGTVVDCRHLDASEAATLYFTSTQHTVIPDVLVASKAWFDTLSPETQAEIRKAARQAVQRQRTLWADAVREANARLEEAGMKFDAPQAREPFYNAVQAVYAQMYAQLGPEFEALIHAILAVK